MQCFREYHLSLFYKLSFYEKNIFKKHEADSRQKLRNNEETQAGWASSNNFKNFLQENFVWNYEQNKSNIHNVLHKTWTHSACIKGV